MSRRIIVKQRIPLGQYSDGWDDCYLLFTALTKADYDQIREAADLSDEEAEAFMDEYLAAHFISGKIRVTDDNNVETLVDAEKGDLDELPRSVKLGVFSDLATGGAQYRNPKA